MRLSFFHHLFHFHDSNRLYHQSRSAHSCFQVMTRHCQEHLLHFQHRCRQTPYPHQTHQYPHLQLSLHFLHHFHRLNFPYLQVRHFPLHLKLNLHYKCPCPHLLNHSLLLFQPFLLQPVLYGCCRHLPVRCHRLK